MNNQKIMNILILLILSVLFAESKNIAAKNSYTYNATCYDKNKEGVVTSCVEYLNIQSKKLLSEEKSKCSTKSRLYKKVWSNKVRCKNLTSYGYCEHNYNGTKVEKSVHRIYTVITPDMRRFKTIADQMLKGSKDTCLNAVQNPKKAGG